MVAFASLEPVFDGCLTRVPGTKELLCPGTFIFFDVQCSSGETKQLGRIIRSGSATVSINVFRPPLPEDNIPLLTYSRLQDTVQVIQTTDTIDIDPAAIVAVSFVIPYMQILDDCHLLEVSGMELVRVLRGRISHGRFEDYCTPTFPSSYNLFFQYYHLNDDVSRTKWVEVVLPIQALISRLLCRAYLLQGDNFCRKRSEPHQFNSQLWGWLSSVLASNGSPPRNVSLMRRSKRLIVRPTTVSATSIQSSAQLIRCETAVQLKAVAKIFGNCCLVGLRDAPPSVNNSVLLKSCACNVILPYPCIETPFVLNTSRLGIDFEHNGAALRVTVRYCKVDGSHIVVQSLFRGSIEPVSLAEVVPLRQDLSIVNVHSFFRLNDGNLAYVTNINEDGSCRCREAQGEAPLEMILPYEFVSNLVQLYRIEELNAN